jgi:hypothetical protein
MAVLTVMMSAAESLLFPKEGQPACLRKSGKPSNQTSHTRPKPDEVGGTCSTGIECAKVQLL